MGSGSIETMTKFVWPIKLALLGLVTAAVFASTLKSGAYNHYYAAIEYSMSKSLSNLFFGAIEPLGSISLDKIPGSFWLPAIMVHFFGFSVWAINLPNVLAFALGTVVLAHTVKTISNQTWGLVAGLIAATTPVLAAVAQSNQPEPAFFLSLTLVIFMSTKALGLGRSGKVEIPGERDQAGSLKYLIFAGLAIALAFQSYMLEAWAIWPALIVGYLMLKKSWLIKIRDLAIAGSLSLVASLAWIIVVSFVPASNRPYIGSTLKNSAWEMVFGYNGLGRFSKSHDALAYKSIAPSFAGPAGIGRLFNHWVAGEIAWMIPATVVAIALLTLNKRFNPFAAMMTTWFATLFVMYSAVAGMHQFYTAILAIPMASLISLALFEAFKEQKRSQVLTLVAVATLTALLFSIRYGSYLRAVTYFQIASLVVLAIFLFTRVRNNRYINLTLVPVLIVALIATPAAWAFKTRHDPSSFNPVAGPMSVQKGAPTHKLALPTGENIDLAPAGQKNMYDTKSDIKSILAYGKSHRAGSAYLFAMFTAVDASPWILDTKEPILPIGGFNGSDPVPTLDAFKKMLLTNKVRLVLDNTAKDAIARKAIAAYLWPHSDSQQILDWVIEHCQHFDDRGQKWEAKRDIYNCSIRH